MNQNDAQGEGDTESQDAAESDPWGVCSAQDQKEQIARMLAREQDPEYQRMVEAAEKVCSRLEDAHAHKLRWEQADDRKIPSEMKIKDAEIRAATDALSTAKEAHHDARGDVPKPRHEAECDGPYDRHASQVPTCSQPPAVQTKARRDTWWDVSSDYIVGVMQSGQYTTAKELYKALEAKAGPDSPFDKGTGQTSGSLYVRDIAQSLSQKAIANKMRDLRAMAKK